MEEKKQKCYEDNRARLQEQGRNKHKKISNEEKDVEREYIRNWYRNMLKEDLKKLKEHQKKKVQEMNLICYHIPYKRWVMKFWHLVMLESFDEGKYVAFLIKDDKLLKEIYNKIWDKEPICDEKNLKTKIKSYGDKISTSFGDKRMPKKGSHCNCLSAILLDSNSRIDKNYYPQEFWQKCKYIVEEKKMSKYIDDELEIPSDESYEKVSDA